MYKIWATQISLDSLKLRMNIICNLVFNGIMSAKKRIFNSNELYRLFEVYDRLVLGTCVKS